MAFRAVETHVALDNIDATPYLEELLDKTEIPARRISTEIRSGAYQSYSKLLALPFTFRFEERVGSWCNPHSRPAVIRGNRRSTSGDAACDEVTHPRQDFSVMKFVSDSGHWPDTQRFDFFLRTRPLTEEERREHAALDSADTNAVGSYPQRDAVLLAIKGLRGIGD